MKKLSKIVLAASFLVMASAPAAAESDRMQAMKAWRECMANVRKSYPVPPGTMQELNQRIQDQCGPRPN